ncbi:hypothetical protein ACS2QD_28955 [Bacillus cereus group sp. Bce036]|uniref:hypothetical protein n=1 Tax=Bacillus cereus TaxID=1396 RepID=UPI000A608EC6|nr:hypothetical protein [Bacillus cereus]
MTTIYAININQNINSKEFKDLFIFINEDKKKEYFVLESKKMPYVPYWGIY